MTTTQRAPLPLEVSIELVKLLMQVAWADDEVGPEERIALHALVRSCGLGERQLEQVDRWLNGTVPCPTPNLAVLRPHRTEVLRQVRRLILADNQLTPEEDAIFSEIATLLD